MSRVLSAASTEAKGAVAELFENTPPVLVEMRFPSAGASPDWHLCEDEEQLKQIMERLGPGAELHLSSVWDLKNIKGALCLRKK
ncbi:MAG TPA: hypothetical protein VMS17_15740 [Gemmataceae bacterium]|nr:hypothetical protein [Gemmataceae bacterium]